MTETFGYQTGDFPLLGTYVCSCACSTCLAGSCCQNQYAGAAAPYPRIVFTICPHSIDRSTARCLMCDPLPQPTFAAGANVPVDDRLARIEELLLTCEQFEASGAQTNGTWLAGELRRILGAPTR